MSCGSLILESHTILKRSAMKLQIKVQKIICWIVLASCVLAFFFALGLATDIYKVMMAGDFGVPGAEIFEDIQPFNRALVFRCILMIVLVIFLFITRTHIRRRYYISNYLTSIAAFLLNTLVPIWGIINILDIKKRYLTEVDFEIWYRISHDVPGVPYTESTLWLDLNIVVLSLMIVVSILLIINLIWKIMLMKYEDKLLADKIKPKTIPGEV